MYSKYINLPRKRLLLRKKILDNYCYSTSYYKCFTTRI